MSLFGRFLERGRDKAYARGLDYLEQGDYAAAITSLREAALDKSHQPTGSLAGFQFRQALLREGHRLLQTADKSAAIGHFSEAVQLWPHYPDLHFFHGAAHGLAGGQWEFALGSAKSALRLNGDYAEARLLEIIALHELKRDREAVDSLGKLVESGRRVDHWLIREFGSTTWSEAASPPPDMQKLLWRCLGGQSEKDEVAAAVALCRAGRWDDGLARFAELVERHPRYPDYRTRYAAVLFQTGDNRTALQEIEAALALNQDYYTAINLKALILADDGQLGEANEFLRSADRDLQEAQPPNSHDALFGAYLRGALALLGGRAEDVAPLFDEWPDLGQQFAKAELLMAAADQLMGRTSEAIRRLEQLVSEWNAEADYFFLLACVHFNAGNFGEMAEVLGRWPAAVDGEVDLRPLYMEGLLSVQQGRVPSVPNAETESSAIAGPAWALLQARAEYLQGHYDACWQLVVRAPSTERVLRLQGRTACRVLAEVIGDWRPGLVTPDSCLPGSVYCAVAGGRYDEAAELVKTQRTAHPESLLGYWLDAAFWLDPVRAWIA